jgi:hypothetical protein
MPATEFFDTIGPQRRSDGSDAIRTYLTSLGLNSIIIDLSSISEHAWQPHSH